MITYDTCDRTYFRAHKIDTAAPHSVPNRAHLDALETQVANLLRMLETERADNVRRTELLGKANDARRTTRTLLVDEDTASAAAGRPLTMTRLEWLRKIGRVIMREDQINLRPGMTTKRKPYTPKSGSRRIE